MQVNPAKYSSLTHGLRLTFQEEGIRGLIKGWGPTAIGYSAQGAGKFGLYEVFKDLFSNILGEQDSYHYRGIVYAVASGTAEFFADIALCPWEMTKVRMQTSDTFPLRLGPALNEMRANAAETRYPFGSLVPLWGRQIPYSTLLRMRLLIVWAWYFLTFFLVRTQTFSRQQILFL